MLAAAQPLRGAKAHEPAEPPQGRIPEGEARRCPDEPLTRPALVLVAVAYDAAANAPVLQRPAPAREFFIQGTTLDGRGFRPSDWAERLASAMACFRPDSGTGSAGGIGAFIGYSPYCVPTVVDGVKCVIVNEALRGLEPMAWDFVMNFARDNRLQLGAVGAPAQPPTAQT